MDDQTWRVTTIGRTMAVAVTVGWLILAVAVTMYAQVSAAVVIALWCGVLALALGTWRFAFVPRITLTDTAVAVVNRVTTVRVPYADIASAQIAYNGITMVTHSGARVPAWAIQKSTIFKLAHKRTHGDDVLAALLARVESAQ